MTEKHFIEQNIEKWRELERLLENSTHDPERLHSLFVKVSSDLSYARTFYPNRSVRLYLNNLTQDVFDKLGTKKRKYSLEPIAHFFKHVLPIEVYQARKAFLVSFIVFAIAVAIGAFSSAQNPDFLAVIIGEDYVEMTEKNINEGDPMKVYKDSEEIDMFFGITINNIRVSFLVFVLGLLGSVGTIFVLMYNGIMLGAFQYFFYSKGLFMTSFLTIWIHGTIEISAIIIAGAAGIILGNGVLFPGTYKRSTALQISALKAVRILMGTVPLFVIAGMLESFVTRHTEMPTGLKVFIIAGSLLFILMMWVVYPMYYYRRNKEQIDSIEILPASDKEELKEKISYRNFEENLAMSIGDYKRNIAQLFSKLILPFCLIFGFALWVGYSNLTSLEQMGQALSIQFRSTGMWNLIIACFGFTALICLVSYSYFINKETFEIGENGFLVFLRRHGFKFMLIAILSILPALLIPSSWGIFLYFVVFPPHFFVIWIHSFLNDDLPFFQSLQKSFSSAWKYYLSFVPEYLLSLVFYFLLYLLLVTGLGSIVYELIMWHQLFESYEQAKSFFNSLMITMSYALTIPFFIYSVANRLNSNQARDLGLDLERRFLKFGKHSSILES